MRKSQKGFTLIELLVVVLIIGILAGIAWPRYELAVLNARYTQAKTAAKILSDAEELYYVKRGSYTSNFSALSINLKAIRYDTQQNVAYFSWGSCSIFISGNRAEVSCQVKSHSGNSLTYFQGFTHSGYNVSGSKRLCIAAGTTSKPTEGDINYQICEQETSSYKTSFGTSSWCWPYL